MEALGTHKEVLKNIKSTQQGDVEEHQRMHNKVAFKNIKSVQQEVEKYQEHTTNRCHRAPQAHNKEMMHNKEIIKLN